MEFKAKLKSLRTQKGITQQELADIVFASRSTVAKWENGLSIPNEQSLQLLADYFGVERSELIGDAAVETTYVKKNAVISRSKKIILWLAIACVLLVAAVIAVAATFSAEEQPVGGSTPRVVGAQGNLTEEMQDFGDYDAEGVPRDENGVCTLTVGETYTLFVAPILTGGSRDAMFDGAYITLSYDKTAFAIEYAFPSDEGDPLIPPYFSVTVLKPLSYAAIVIEVDGFTDTLVICAE